jgi:beta-lactamase class C
MRSSIKLLLLSLAVLVGCSKKEEPHTPEKRVIKVANPHLEALLKNYEQYFNDSLQKSGTPGAAVVIVKDSQIVLERGFGIKMAGSRDSVDEQTVFRIGSLSKGFASILTGILVQDGQLHWRDPVVKFLPDFELNSIEQTKRIKLFHLLSHTTGLPYQAFSNLIEDGYDLPEIIKKFKEVKLFGKEGEVFNYQNAAYSVIEEVMWQATGKTYQQLLVERIFHPLGMKNASLSYRAMVLKRNKSFPHDFNGHAWVKTNVTGKYYNSAAAGGVNACADDMGKWLTLLLGNRPDILKQTTLDSIFSPIIATNNENHYFAAWPGQKEAFYARGWRVLHNNTETYICHGGYVNGYRAEIALNPAEGIGICILFNAATGFTHEAVPAFFTRYEKYRSAIHSWSRKYYSLNQ